MTASKLPAPPIPADADLTHYDDMPLEVRRLRDSGIAGEADAEVFRCGLLSWCVAWHQLPAGSLPPSDAELCRLVGLGRDLKTWGKLKAGAMRGWRLFSDGRLYHPVVTEKVIDGWNGTLLNRWGKECDRIRKENKAREKEKGEKLEFPRKPDIVPYVWPPESAWISVGIPTENDLNRMEGNGCLERAPTGLSRNQTSPPAAERASGPEGRAHDDVREIPIKFNRMPS